MQVTQMVAFMLCGPKQAHPACKPAGRLFMWLAFAGERVLTKLGTTHRVHGGWFDFWRGMVGIPQSAATRALMGPPGPHNSPCPVHGDSGACPYL